MADEIDDQAFQDIRELMEDDFLSFLQTYLTGAHKYADMIVRGFEEKDAKMIEDAAHPLKSSSRHIGFVMLSKTAERIELSAKAIQIGAGEFEDIEAYVAKIPGLIEQVEKKIEAA